MQPGSSASYPECMAAGARGSGRHLGLVAQLDQLAPARMLADLLQGWGYELRGLCAHAWLQEILVQYLLVILLPPAALKGKGVVQLAA